ncbi:hypothetical protein STA3757_41690 [Stanieria sp. NIES-3757]|nr:hypothetical protein STA3757_41690 [Stanieria sp. NIES-3757]
MKCCYRGVVYDCQVISLEVREKEIMGMYRGGNLYSSQIQTQLKSYHHIPRLTKKYRGNIHTKNRQQYCFNADHNHLKNESYFDSFNLCSE